LVPASREGDGGGEDRHVSQHENLDQVTWTLSMHDFVKHCAILFPSSSANYPTVRFQEAKSGLMIKLILDSTRSGSSLSWQGRPMLLTTLPWPYYSSRGGECDAKRGGVYRQPASRSARPGGQPHTPSCVCLIPLRLPLLSRGHAAVQQLPSLFLLLPSPAASIRW